MEEGQGGQANGHRRGYRQVNRAAWDWLSRGGCDSSRPFGPREFRAAAQHLDPDGWLPWRRLRRVLCLAAGGGQQGPLFAWLGFEVTVVDLSWEQLQRDREVAARHDLRIECVQADMLDLSILRDRRFDLVYQPISTCYVPDVRGLYREVRDVLRPDGLYFAKHLHPAHMQLDFPPRWQDGYLLRRPEGSAFAVEWPCQAVAGVTVTARCLHHLHSLGQLLGCLCDAGFAIRRYAEGPVGDPAAAIATPEHVAAYAPSWLRLLARRIPGRTGQRSSARTR